MALVPTRHQHAWVQIDDECMMFGRFCSLMSRYDKAAARYEYGTEENRPNARPPRGAARAAARGRTGPCKTAER